MQTVIVIRLVLLKFVLFVCLALCVATVSAQSKCEKNANGILECDLSVSLVEAYTDTSGEIAERAWQPTLAEQDEIRQQLQRFSELWCSTTIGKSRIRQVSVFKNYKKSSANVALYRGTGRSYAYAGTYPRLKPSIVLYYAGFYDLRTVDPYLYKVLVHEFAHAALKIYDEYVEPGVNSSSVCLRPLQSDNPRATIMNNHISYTRFSHAQDYAQTPPAQTAQYRCYGESAWDVLLQPSLCDSTLSLYLNAWFPRQDYFAVGSSCMPSSPSINTLENPGGELEVRNCIAATRRNLYMNFLTSSDNIMMVIDSGMNQESKAMVAKAMNQIMDTLSTDDTDIKLAIVYFNSSDTSSFMDVTQNNVAVLTQKVDQILGQQPVAPNTMDETLDFVQTGFSDDTDSVNNGYNAVVIISDTLTIPSSSTLGFFDAQKIPVYTIGIGETANPGLQMLSMETGGEYYTVSAHDDAEFLTSLIVQNLPFMFESPQDDTSVPIDIDLHTGSLLMPRASTQTTLVYPQPMIIIARVHGDMPLLNAKVTAEITAPDDAIDPIRLNLLDNGEAPDMVGSDGVYSGVLRNYHEFGDGIYTVAVTASNPAGRAVFDDVGVATFATTQREVARLAPSFVRSQYDQIEVTGTRPFLPNTNYINARDIEDDGTMAWGFLGLIENVNWYRFRASQNGYYYIETSNLQGLQNYEFVTDLKLYEQDPNNDEPLFLAPGVRYQGVNTAFIQYRLEINKDYLVSVSPASDYGGSYALTVMPEFSLILSFEMDRARNANDGGSRISRGGGGSVDYLLLLLLLVVAAYTKSRRKTAYLS